MQGDLTGALSQEEDWLVPAVLRAVSSYILPQIKQLLVTEVQCAMPVGLAYKSSGSAVGGVVVAY